MPRLFDLKLISLLFFVTIIGFIAFSFTSSIEAFGINVMKGEEKKVEEIIRKAAVTCYALEGQYPAELNYLEENYGVIIDRTVYAYWYDAVGSNVMPSIVVKSLIVDAAEEIDYGGGELIENR